MSHTSHDGNFNKRVQNLENIDISDFRNPWNFYSLFLQSNDVVYEWLRRHGLLASSLRCEKCAGNCTLSKRSAKRGGFTFRCTLNRNHEYSMFKNSFFDRGHTDVRDVLQFLKSYLEKCSLLTSATHAGINYGSTGVKWGSYVRKVFVDYYSRSIQTLKFSGEVEIEESLFGRQTKHHRGKITGIKVWISGMAERFSNRIIIYPVDQRDEETLVPLIKAHVEEGSTIFSDGWASYLNLNDYGFSHFSVIHKTAFKQTYRNDATEEEVVCHTNKIEGAWKHAKQHFKSMSGTNMDNFESHLCEVMYRSHRRGNVFNNFTEDLKVIYSLEAPQTTTSCENSWGMLNSTNSLFSESAGTLITKSLCIRITKSLRK